MAANSREHSLGGGNEQIGDEYVGMLRREIVGREALGWKVPQVPSHDRVRSGFNRGGQHMDVVRVWQIETSGMCRVSCHNGFAKSDRENLRRKELSGLRSLADEYLALDAAGLAAAQAVGAIIEVECDDQAV